VGRGAKAAIHGSNAVPRIPCPVTSMILTSSTKLGVFGDFPMFSTHKPGAFDKSRRLRPSNRSPARNSRPSTHSHSILCVLAPWREMPCRLSFRHQFTDEHRPTTDQNRSKDTGILFPAVRVILGESSVIQHPPRSKRMNSVASARVFEKATNCKSRLPNHLRSRQRSEQKQKSKIPERQTHFDPRRSKLDDQKSQSPP
jgi:hypothetical protein